MGTNATWGDQPVTEFKNLETLSYQVEQEPDPSGVDTIFWRHTIQVKTLVHLDSRTIMGAGITGQTAPTTLGESMRRLEEQLNTQRQHFTYKIDDETVLDVYPHDPKMGNVAANVDVNCGPITRSFKWRPIGERTAEIEWTVVCCVAGASVGQGILSNRWYQEDTIDQNHFMTRTFRGQLRLVSPQANPMGVHAYRSLVTPQPLGGFKRVRQTFTGDASGLVLNYEIVDEQQAYGPPKPATDWKVTHRLLSTFLGEGIGTTAICSVKLWGPEGVSKTQLLSTAAKVAKDRLGALRDGISITCEIVDHMHEPTIEYTRTVRVPGVFTAEGGLLDASKIGKPLSIEGYNRLEHRVPTTFGTTNGAGILVCYLQEPGGSHGFLLGSAQPTPITQGQGGVETSTFQVDNAALGNPEDVGFTNNHKEAQYLEYEIDHVYDLDVGRIQLPIARSSTAQGGQGQSAGVPQPALPTSAIIPLYPPQGKLTIRVQAARSGKPPELPKPMDFDQGSVGFRLLFARTPFSAEKLSADGKTKNYSAAVEYVFAMTRPLQFNEKIRTGAVPWLSREGLPMLEPNEVFKENIA